MRHNTLSRAVIAALLLISVVALVRMPQRTHGATQTPDSMHGPTVLPATTQRAYAPMPHGSWTDGEVILNNNSPAATTVKPTFFSHGAPVAAQSVTLRPGEVRWLSMADLLAPTGRALHAIDAMEIEYQ